MLHLDGYSDSWDVSHTDTQGLETQRVDRRATRTHQWGSMIIHRGRVTLKIFLLAHNDITKVDVWERWRPASDIREGCIGFKPLLGILCLVSGVPSGRHDD
jgi:hypothetical protein